MQRLEVVENLVVHQYHLLTGARAPPVEVAFYPYTRMKSTIRERDGTLKIRISDLLDDAPISVLKSLISILLCKIDGRACPEHYRQHYADHIQRPAIRERTRDCRRERGRKRHGGRKSEYHDLHAAFRRVNERYFDGDAPHPTIVWSKKRTYRTFGTHDAAFGMITLSRTLDDPQVPAFVVDYVLYHELLHCIFKTTYENGRRQIHTDEFTQRETAFTRYAEAERWLQRLAAKERRRAGT